MKYLTKEWYETCQKTDYHGLIEVSKKAETFSEEYFVELYKEKEKEFLELEKGVSEITFEEMFPEDFYTSIPLDSELYEQAKAEYYKRREEARVDFLKNPTPPFDAEKTKSDFKNALDYNIDRIKRDIPEEILSDVADIRVLALDVASAKVKKAITKYCNKNRKIVDKTLALYRKSDKKEFKKGEPDFVKRLSLHDCKVISCDKSGNDMVLSLDNSGGFTDINKVIFENCTVIKQDDHLEEAWCLYEEVYKSGDGYEIHFLMVKEENLIDYIVVVTNVCFE